MEFYKLEVGFLTQQKFAWFEPDNSAKYSDEFPKCPMCGGAIGPRWWLPPCEVIVGWAFEHYGRRGTLQITTYCQHLVICM